MQNFFPKKIFASKNRNQKSTEKIADKKSNQKNSRTSWYEKQTKTFPKQEWEPYYPYLSPKPHDQKFITAHTNQQKPLHKKLQQCTTSSQSI